MKMIDRIESWTRRNLKWLLPFIIVMPFILWYWNAHIDAIGYWLWLVLHGQKFDEVLLIAIGLVGLSLMVIGLRGILKHGGRR